MNNKATAITTEELVEGLRKGRYHNAEVVLRSGNGGAYIVAYNGLSKVHASAEPLSLESPEIARYVGMQLELELDNQNKSQENQVGEN